MAPIGQFVKVKFTDAKLSPKVHTAIPMKKFYVLDTNVLLHDPNALLRFEDNDVVLPITVIEELDRFKKAT